MHILLVFLMLFTLTGCWPALIGGAATSSTLVIAKSRTLGETAEDVTISAGIKKDFMAQGFRDLYGKIDVQVVEGRVLYTGTVGTDDDIVKALDIAWAQKGVKEVVNELQVSENSNYFDAAEYARDTWITGRIKAKTISQRDIKFINYTVVTSKGVVYLFGIARSQEELDKVTSIAAEIKGVARVVSHVHLKDTIPVSDD